MASETTAIERSGVTPARGCAFISAPRSVDTSVLRQALVRLGLTPSSLDDAGTGQSLADFIRSTIDRAEFVIAVLGEERSREGVFFEIGMAHALGKRVLLLVPRGDDVPPLLAGIPYLRSDPSNREAIKFGLDQLLSAPAIKAAPRAAAGRETRPIGAVADELLEQLRTLSVSGRITEASLHGIIHRAVEASGVAAITHEHGNKGLRADIAIWSDDFEPWIGNPFLIELKCYPLRGPELENTINRIVSMMNQLKIRSGLLIHFGQSEAIEMLPDTGGKASASRLFVLSAEQFLQSLKHTGLGELLRRMRNERAHGRG